MGWCRTYWVCGASALAIDPSGWRVLLASLIPTYLQASRRNIIYHTIFLSHYGHESRLSESTSTRGATSRICSTRDACPLFSTSGFLSILFLLQSIATLKEGDQFQMSFVLSSHEKKDIILTYPQNHRIQMLDLSCNWPSYLIRMNSHI